MWLINKKEHQCFYLIGTDIDIEPIVGNITNNISFLPLVQVSEILLEVFRFCTMISELYIWKRYNKHYSILKNIKTLFQYHSSRQTLGLHDAYFFILPSACFCRYWCVCSSQWMVSSSEKCAMEEMILCIIRLLKV